VGPLQPMRGAHCEEVGERCFGQLQVVCVVCGAGSGGCINIDTGYHNGVAECTHHSMVAHGSFVAEATRL
jgi:hypothetical protein